jgi:hypothetical protein
MFNRLDLVRTASGAQFIITGPPKANRPANPYSGVKVNGKGAEYKFGPKHNPVKIGTVTEDHPALQALNGRNSVISEPAKAAMRQLLQAIDICDDIHEAAHLLAPHLRQMV